MLCGLFLSGSMVSVIDTNQIQHDPTITGGSAVHPNWGPRGVTRMPPVIAGEVASNSSVNYGLWMFMDVYGRSILQFMVVMFVITYIPGPTYQVDDDDLEGEKGRHGRGSEYDWPQS